MFARQRPRKHAPGNDGRPVAFPNPPSASAMVWRARRQLRRQRGGPADSGGLEAALAAPPILSVGAHGLAVADVHALLRCRSALPRAAAAEEAERSFGPVTAGAVGTFQASIGLRPDGVVGPRTWLALRHPAEGPPAQVPAPVLDGASALARAAVLLAHGELRAAVEEVPLGSHRGPRVDLYLTGDSEDAPYLLQARRAHASAPAASDGWQGAPWAGRFVRWCIDRAARQLGQRSPLQGAGELVSAWQWRDLADRAGTLRTAPAAGHVALIAVDGDGERPPAGHLALLASPPLADRTIWTREGGSGERVTARRRPLSDFSAFVELR